MLGIARCVTLCLFISSMYHRVPLFTLWLSVLCMHSEAWFAGCVSLRLARLPRQAVLSAHVAFAPHARLRQAFSHMLRSQIAYFLMCAKLRYPGGMCCYRRVLLDIHFPLCIFKKLLHRTLGIEELSEVYTFNCFRQHHTLSLCVRVRSKDWCSREHGSHVSASPE